MTRPGLRELRKHRTRHAIVRAAYELFTDRGFDSTSMEQIADRAEVALRTLYRYFPTKLDIVTPGRTALETQLREMPPAPTRSSAVQALVEPVLHVARWLDSLEGADAALIALATRDPAIRAALTTLLDEIAATIADHTMAGNLADRHTALVAASMAIAGMFAGTDGRPDHSFTQAAHDALALLATGAAHGARPPGTQPGPPGSNDERRP